MKLFFAADKDIELWPHFLSHYQSLGFTHFYCSGTDCPLQGTDYLTVVPHVRDEKLSYFKSLHKALQDLIDNSVDQNEWFGIAELDEFHDFGESLQDIIQKANANEWNVILGVLVDRVATDGSLPELRPDVPIYEQFPASSKITEAVLAGCTLKVMMCRGRKKISGGNHTILDGHTAYPNLFKVNHFKWHATVLRRMQERVAMPTDDGDGWIRGNKLVLRHWEEHKSVLYGV